MKTIGKRILPDILYDQAVLSLKMLAKCGFSRPDESPSQTEWFIERRILCWTYKEEKRYNIRNITHMTFQDLP